MTAPHIAEFRAAVDAQAQRASLYSNGYATEERNYWTSALGEGETRLTLKEWMRQVGQDSEANQRAAYEASEHQRVRTLPQGCEIGRQDLAMCEAIDDPIMRAQALGELLEQAQALLEVAAKVKRDALCQAKDSMGAVALAGVLGVSRARVYQLIAIAREPDHE